MLVTAPLERKKPSLGIIYKAVLEMNQTIPLKSECIAL